MISSDKHQIHRASRSVAFMFFAFFALLLTFMAQQASAAMVGLERVTQLNANFMLAQDEPIVNGEYVKDVSGAQIILDSAVLTQVRK